MNVTEYQDMQDRILLAAISLTGLPYGRFLQTAAKADTLGPILDPTLYRDGAPALNAIRLLARRANDFQAAFLAHAGALEAAVTAAADRARAADVAGQILRFVESTALAAEAEAAEAEAAKAAEGPP